jgi:copper chaperone CopZ
MKTLVFHVAGMHCPACEKLAELELRSAPGVSSAKASFSSAACSEQFDSQSDDLREFVQYKRFREMKL